MATLNVTEFKNGASLGVNVNAGGVDGKTSQNVTFSASVQSSAFQDETTVVRVVADAACYIDFGADPTADAGGIYMPANAVEYFGVPKGAAYKVAAVTA